MKVSIKISPLIAANLFASKDGVYRRMNGVYLEDNGASLNLVATDGNRLIIIPEWMEDGDREPEFSFTIPSGLLTQIKILKGITHCDLEYDNETKMITIIYNHNKYTGFAIDETFPDYTRSIPKSPDKEDNHGVTEICFNPKYLGDFAKINRLLGHKEQGIKMTMVGSRDPTVITMGGELSEKYLALLMPMKL